MADIEKVIKGLEFCTSADKNHMCEDCPYFENEFCNPDLMSDAFKLLKEQESRVKRYEYVFDFLGIGFREWITKIIVGEAEAICETDEHELKTTITFKMI